MGSRRVRTISSGRQRRAACTSSFAVRGGRTHICRWRNDNHTRRGRATFNYTSTHAGIEALAVGFLHAYADDRHERRAAEILSAELPELTICRSSEICPEIREYERFSTTVANAYIRPLMSGYLLRLRDKLAAKGFDCPTYLMMSSGGLSTVVQAVRTPIRRVESGCRRRDSGGGYREG